MDRAKPATTEAGGNREALERVVASYSTYLMAVAGKIKGQHLQTQEGVSDLVQQTLVNALCLIRDDGRQISFGTDAELKAWLVGVLQNTYQHMRRYYKARKRAPVALPEPPRSPTPSAMAMLNEELQNRRRALESLDVREQELIRWRDEEELTFKAIGKRRGYSESFAKVALIERQGTRSNKRARSVAESDSVG